MKISKMLNETFECVKINGILRNLTNDEMKIYKRVKNEGKLFKADLTEFEANVATSMVTKGLLRRKKSQQEQGKHGRIYYIARGRKGHLSTKEIDEVAPPGKEAESWIKKNKKRFKDRYGDGYEKYLYGKAWNNYNGKRKLKESANDDEVKEYEIGIEDNRTEKQIKEAYEYTSNLLQIIDGCIADSGENQLTDEYRRNQARRRAYIKILRNFSNEDFWDYDNPINQTFTIDNGDMNINDDILDELKNCIREDAYDSGEYNQFDEGEFDGDSTWESIADYGVVSLIDEYLDFDDFKNYGDDIVENCNKFDAEVNEAQINYQQWDGSEDNTQQSTAQVPYEQKRKEIIAAIKQKLEQLYKVGKNINEKINDEESLSRRELSDLEDFCDWASYRNPLSDFDGVLTEDSYTRLKRILAEFESIWERYKDRAYDTARDSGDFDKYYDSEFNSERTWEEIDEHSYYELADSFSYSSSIWDYITDIRNILSQIITFCDNRLGNNVSTGEEFDESVSYKF